MFGQSACICGKIHTCAVTLGVNTVLRAGGVVIILTYTCSGDQPVCVVTFTSVVSLGVDTVLRAGGVVITLIDVFQKIMKISAYYMYKVRLINSSPNVGSRLTNRSRGWHHVTKNQSRRYPRLGCDILSPNTNSCCLHKTLGRNSFSCTSVTYAFQRQIYRKC